MVAQVRPALRLAQGLEPAETAPHEPSWGFASLLRSEDAAALPGQTFGKSV